MRVFFVVACVACCASSIMAEPAENPARSISEVLSEIGESAPHPAGQAAPWWREQTISPIDPNAQAIPVGIADLVELAVQHSASLSVARHLPAIRETAIIEADSTFDWNSFVNSLWEDTSEPVGSSLTLGNQGQRFRDHNLTIDGGLRRRTTQGGSFEVYQQFGHQNNNSSFFVPNDQGSSRIVLGFTQPLLRGRGFAYNTSLTLLAEIDVGTAHDEVCRQIQTHLLEVARGYWGLYLERASLAQKVNLYLKTQEIVDQLASRRAVDTQRSQLVSAQAALQARRAELIRARAAVKNSETRLRALLNAPSLSGDPESLELIPIDHPVNAAYPTDLYNEFATAMQERPEIAASLKEIKAASVRTRMAEHEILPVLNLVTETYVAGLRGESAVGDAWLDQFREGEPSYSVGLQFEVPLGRRAARARLTRRELEISKLREEYRSAMELIRAEVEVAVREIETSYRELHAKQRSLEAAELEVETLKIRWEHFADPNNTSSLLLESLLRAQERVTQAEFESVQAELTYNLALINLRKANGTLTQVAPLTREPVPVEASYAESSYPIDVAERQALDRREGEIRLLPTDSE